MENYLLEIVYISEGSVPTGYPILSKKYWDKNKMEDCYVKEGNLLFKPIKYKSKNVYIIE